MLWFSIALVIISTEIVLTILYFNSRSKPEQEISEKNDVLLDIEKLNERLKHWPTWMVSQYERMFSND